MYTSVIPSLPLSLLLGNKQSCDLNYWLPEKSVFFARARQGIGMSGAVTGLKKGDVILMPSSICKEVLKPFAWQGIKIRYYRLDKELQADIADIESRIDDTVKAIYINHYHGNPTPMKPFRKVCDQYGLLLFEDCAHGLFGRNADGDLLGQAGDISFFSLWKFFPVPNGGVMCLNNVVNERAVDSGGTLSPCVDRTMVVRLIINNLAQRNLLPLTMLKNLKHGGQSYPAWSDEAGDYEDIMPMSIDPLSYRIIAASRCDEIIYRRRKYYEYALSHLPEGVVPLNKVLPEGAVPFAFPILAPDKKARNVIFERMAAKGYVLEPSVNYVYRCFDTIENRDEEFADTDYLADRALCIPVHQMLGEHQVETMMTELHGIVGDM